jgi:MraZ protein
VKQGGQEMFLGEYKHNLTKGNRLALPSKIRAVIKGEEVVLAKGFEHCILGYEKSSWEKMAETELIKPVSEKEARKIRRQLFSGASLLEIDPQGRLVLPKNLLDYAEAGNEVLVIGAGDHFEIWTVANWKKYLSQIEALEEDV